MNERQNEKVSGVYCFALFESRVKRIKEVTAKFHVALDLSAIIIATYNMLVISESIS